MENVVLFGGTFDPIHNGHLRIARAASMFLNADVIFVPAKNPPGKEPIASPEQRLSMLRLALKADGSSSFSISLFEMKSKEQVNYWVDTVSYFAAKCKHAKLYFLIGADEVNAFPSWKDPERICSFATPLYVSRPDVKIEDEVLRRFRMTRLCYETSGEVSSSAVRSLQSMDIPVPVREYIEQKQLYYFQAISSLISKHRLVHSVSVARLCYEMAVRNRRPDPGKAYIAGLLHDVGKGIGPIEGKKLMKKVAPDYADMPEWTYHQFLGAEIAKSRFGISDEGILDAIRYHATGKAHMGALGKIVYSADKTDPLRGYDSKKLIAACMKNYYLGFTDVLRANKEDLLSKGNDLDNPLTAACMNQYLGEDK